MNEVYKIFEEYSSNNKLFDKEAILKILNIIKERYELDKYLLEIYIEDKNPNYKELGTSCGNYDMHNYDIHIYIEDIKVKVKQKLYEYGEIIDINEYNYFRNVYILYVLFHELEHVIQVKLMKESNNTTSNILRMSEINSIEDLLKKGLSIKEIEMFFQERQKIYKKNYKDCPMERFADINACIKLKYLVDKNGNLKSISNFLQTLIYYYMIRAYRNRENSPTIRYITAMGNSNLLKQFDWYDENDVICLSNCQKKYQINDRVIFGFPISNEEYQFIISIMDQHDILGKVR